ncbi:MFS transporter [Amycolatopsis sp. GA6-003]|uniref:MFS transporter n=1 Tax=Amycolatopsis sp. GA6-003 TaxID=2652444 RepID=UPI003916F5A2
MLEETTSSTAGPREWAGLAVLLLPCVLASMDMSVMFVAMPSLTADLEPSGSQLLWIMDSYGFLLAGLLITMGTLGDRIGRRRLLLAGAAAFGGASVLAAFSATPTMLIVARMLLGIAGATLAPSTLALIRGMFHDARQRATAVGLWTAGFAGGAVLGPIIGGLLLQHFHWGSVFLINVPVMLLLLALGPLLLPEHRTLAEGPFDLLGAVLSIGSVLGIVYGVKQLAAHGFGWLPIAGCVAGLVAGVAFVRRQRTAARPLIDLALVRSRAFAVPLLIDLLATFALVGFNLFTWQYLQVVLGMSPLESALWALPTFAVMPVGIGVAATLAARIGKPRVLAIGLLVAAAGFGLLALPLPGAAYFIAALTVVSLGIAGVAAVVTDVILSAAPPERAGMASAMAETSAEFGGAMGIALLGSIGAAVYRAAMPSGAETLEAAAKLPPGDALREAAFAAFSTETGVAAVVCAGLMLGAAVVIVRVR